MLVGHYAAGFAIRRWAPAVPLAALLLATQLVDVAWALLVLAGIEHVDIVSGWTASNDMALVHVPYTHSLAATVLWVAGAALVARRLWPAAGTRGALLVGLAVASHWLLDLPVHVRDLPLVGDRWKVGFGLWNHREAALALELGVLAAAIVVWSRGLARPAVAWACFAVLALVQVVTTLLPTPSPEPVLAAVLLGFYVLVAAAAVPVARRAEGPPGRRDPPVGPL